MILNGTKIILRKPHKSDAPYCYENLKNEVYNKMAMLPYPYTLEMAEQFIRKTQSTRRKGTDQIFTIEEKETGRLVGMLGLHGLKNRHRHCEMGYWLAKGKWGLGYITEAINLALKFAFKELKLERVYANTLPHNKGSMKVLEKNGFKLEGVLRRHFKHRGRFVDAYYFGILKSEFTELTK